MSAPEAATPVAAVEEVKPAESVPAPEPPVPAVEAPKPEETTQSSDKDATKVEPAQESAAEPSTNPEPQSEATPTVTEEAKPAEVSSDAKKEDQQRSPSFLTKLLAPFKGRIPKSPKKEKKEEDKLPEDSTVKASEAPATEETPAEPVAEPAQPAPEAVTSEPPAETAAEPDATETEAPKKEVKEEKKPEKRDAKQSAVKVGRRLSSRVSDLFKSKKAESSTAAKVDEHPPVIEEHAPVAPLEHPAVGDAPAPAEEPKSEVPPAAPVVAAAA